MNLLLAAFHGGMADVGIRLGGGDKLVASSVCWLPTSCFPRHSKTHLALRIRVRAAVADDLFFQQAISIVGLVEKPASQSVSQISHLVQTYVGRAAELRIKKWKFS